MLIESPYNLTQEQILHDKECVEAAKKDPKKFDVLYNKYYEPILQFVFKRIEGKEASYDITAQVFLNAMINLSKYKFVGVPFSAWLYRIAIGEIQQSFRKNKIQRTIKVDIEEVKEIVQEFEEESKELQYQQILNALGELPEESIQLIEMRYFEKRSFKEIGAILNLTENNAKVKVYRILDKLKEILNTNK